MMESNYRIQRRNRRKRYYRIRLGVLKMIYSPILFMLLIPLAICTMYVWYKKEAIIAMFDVPRLIMPLYKYSCLTLMVMIPIIILVCLLEEIGVVTAKKDEADLQEVFKKEELRNGSPILIDKKKIKNSDVIMREFYTEIPMEIWIKRKDAIADLMNIHYVKRDQPFSYGGKAQGRKILMYSGKGRENPQRGELYDEQF